MEWIPFPLQINYLCTQAPCSAITRRVGCVHWVKTWAVSRRWNSAQGQGPPIHLWKVGIQEKATLNDPSANEIKITFIQ